MDNVVLYDHALTASEVQALATQATIDVSAGSTLELSGSTITGGTITDNNLINVTADITLNGFARLESGEVHVGAKLTLDNVAISGSDLSEVSGGSIEIDHTALLTHDAIIAGLPITNLGTLEVAGTFSPSADATLDGLAFDNTFGHIELDAGSTLVLDDGTAITGGTLDFGAGSTLHIEHAGGAGQDAFLHGVTLTGDVNIVIDTLPATRDMENRQP
jgi:hypothetical protein